jgi:hypothetical protein
LAAIEPLGRIKRGAKGLGRHRRRNRAIHLRRCRLEFPSPG